jgi:hypothetical protein
VLGAATARAAGDHAADGAQLHGSARAGAEPADPGRPDCAVCRERNGTHLLRDLWQFFWIIAALMVFYAILDSAGLLGLFARLGRWFGQ